MSKLSTFETLLLAHIFHDVSIPLVGSTGGMPASGTVGSLYISLHTAEPSSGLASQFEVSYTGYARVAVARTVGAWAFNGASSVRNAAAVSFPPCTAGTATATHFGIGCEATGASTAGGLLYWGALTVPLGITSTPTNITPVFAINSLVVTED